MKQTEQAITGDDKVNEHIDQATPAADAWGVEEAREKNKHDASESSFSISAQSKRR